MPEFSLLPLDAGSLPTFSQYLLPKAMQAMRDNPAEAIALGLTTGHYAAGAACAEVRGAEAAVTSLFIDPAARRHGAANFLLDALITLCRERGARTLYAEYSLSGSDLTAMDALFRIKSADVQPQEDESFRMDSALFHDAPLIRAAFSAFIPASGSCSQILQPFFTAAGGPVRQSGCPGLFKLVRLHRTRRPRLVAGLGGKRPCACLYPGLCQRGRRMHPAFHGTHPRSIADKRAGPYPRACQSGLLPPGRGFSVLYIHHGARVAGARRAAGPRGDIPFSPAIKPFCLLPKTVQPKRRKETDMQTYQKKQPMSPASPRAVPATQPQSGPSMDALRAGTAQPTADMLGHKVDLPGQMQAKMESAFGADLSGVQLYESQAVADAGAGSHHPGQPYRLCARPT